MSNRYGETEFDYRFSLERCVEPARKDPPLLDVWNPFGSLVCERIAGENTRRFSRRISEREFLVLVHECLKAGYRLNNITKAIISDQLTGIEREELYVGSSLHVKLKPSIQRELPNYQSLVMTRK